MKNFIIIWFSIALCIFLSSCSVPSPPIKAKIITMFENEIPLAIKVVQWEPSTSSVYPGKLAP